jgi:hypothetical protein
MSQGETKFKFMIFLRQGHNTITVNQAIKEERIINALLVWSKNKKKYNTTDLKYW